MPCPPFPDDNAAELPETGLKKSFMSNKIVRRILPLGFMWPVSDPFLFCAHHLDHFPAGNADLSPKASLSGRNIGQDFTLKDGWRMYHGTRIPGFPAHPHRGFETVTIVASGMVDHADSLGQAGRYGNGDVQWMTAGSGVQHSEMFPLLNPDGENTAELFQIWLNLPAASKFAAPYYKMLWNEDIPVLKHSDENHKITEVRILCGKLGELIPPAPAPDSWAAQASNQVMILMIRMEAGAAFTIPAAKGKLNRSLYFYRGETMLIGNENLKSNSAAELDPERDAEIMNGPGESYALLLQGQPLDEPVVQYGPFVMNTEAEILQAFSDFRETEFGGWPWPRTDMVHPAETGRFAQYTDGQTESR
jgi:quercetin 2,3-dioxygenase